MSDLLSYSNMDLLCLLVGSNEASEIYKGSLHPLFRNGDPAYPTSRHPRLIAARELVRRWLAEEMKLGAVLFEPSKVKEYLQVSTRGLEHEVFLGLFLDSRNRLIVALELFRGTLTQTSVYPREVVRAALKVNAASMIVAHNHPSGSHEPSQADRMLTRTLREALALVDVALLDHFIVSDTVVVSMAERGEM